MPDDFLPNDIKLVYTAGPYRAATINGVQENLWKARQTAVKYWRKGFGVICPHMNTAYMDGAMAHAAGFADSDIFIKADLQMIEKCIDIVVMIPGWEKSEGAKIEHRFALHCGKEIIYETEEGIRDYEWEPQAVEAVV